MYPMSPSPEGRLGASLGHLFLKRTSDGHGKLSLPARFNLVLESFWDSKPKEPGPVSCQLPVVSLSVTAT